MTRKVAVTGARGFIGRNLMLRLAEKGIVAEAIAHDASSAQMEAALAGAEAVFHCAGVNRPETEDEFFAGNVGMTQRLCDALSATGSTAFLAYTSTIHAMRDNAYGQSKRQAEEVVLRHGASAGAGVAVFRLPNVFGKWARPNYNSAVATFCHNIARDLPISIHDPAAVVELVYVDDVCTKFLSLLENPPVGQGHADVAPVYSVTVGELADQLRAFRESRSSLVPGPVGEGFARALYATYLSCLPPSEFAYPLKAHVDPRGMFAEMLRTRDSGQFSFFTAHPGITRGGHYHHTKNEKFLVVKGQARFGFRHVVTGETFSIDTDGAVPRVVETVPGWAHDITNIGGDEMVVLLWANETFDPANPDTVTAKVGA